MPRARVALGFITALCLSQVTTLWGQSVRGQLVAAATGEALPGVLVLLLDSTGSARDRALTDELGRYALSTTQPGIYRVRALRIGHEKWESGPLVLGARETVERRLAMTLTPIVLAGIEVAAEDPCRIRPEEGRTSAALWEEIKKALTATELTIARRAYRFRTAVFQRELAPNLVQVSERREERIGFSDWPFESLPPESLAADGFVQLDPRGGGPIYYAPDIRVLFSDVFLNRHCFKVMRPSATAPGLLGLAFEPARRGRLPDIKGVIWLDRATTELRYLEFTYTDLWGWVPAERSGGRIEFERLPTGGWIVSKWWIRAPIPGIREQQAPMLYGFRETGGEVLAVMTATGRPVR
jgi:carboxypeptidase family protein